MINFILIIGLGAIAGLNMQFDISVSTSASFFMAAICLYLLVSRWANFRLRQRISLACLIIGCLTLGVLFVINQYISPVSISSWLWVLAVLPPGIILAIDGQYNKEAIENDESNT